MTKVYLHALGASVTAALLAVEMADKALCQVPGVSHLRVRALDSLFGPEEPFEFTGTTTPHIT